MSDNVPRARGPLGLDLTPRAVDVVAWWLTCAPDEVDLLRGYLSPDECARANRFVFARDRQRFIVSRGRLREVLGELRGCPPGEIRFAVSERGKLSLDDRGGRLRFNVAHSNDLMLCAITLDHEVGIDVEHVRRRRRVPGLRGAMNNASRARSGPTPSDPVRRVARAKAVV